MKYNIIAALPVRWTTQDCAECGRTINGPAVRVAIRENGTVHAVAYHPHIDEDLEQRPCAPENKLVRAAIEKLPSVAHAYIAALAAGVR